MVYVYAIRLEQNKYYIGKTTNPKFRLNDHFNSCGSAWTKKYHPLEVLEVIPDCDSFDEDKYTKIYMSKYGINNVRGGSYCRFEIPRYQLDSLKKELDTATDKCFLCGEKNHFVKECPLDFCIISKKELVPDHIKMCYMCGRRGHCVQECYARSHVRGQSLENCYHCGRADHWKITCNHTTDIYGRYIGNGWMIKYFGW